MEAQLLLNIDKIGKFISTSEIPPEKIIELTAKINYNTYGVYTGGSRFDNETGFAVCIFKNNEPYKDFLYKLNPTNSVFQAELAAISVATDWALEHNQLGNMHSNSQSSIETIKSVEPKSEFVNDIKKKIYNSKRLVGLTWVKAHAGNPGNERADGQATLATTMGQYLDLPTPYSYVKLKIKQFVIHEWENYWNKHDSSSVIRVRTFMDKVDKKCLTFNKYLIYFLSGHGPFRAFLHRFHLLSSPCCSCGQMGNANRYK
ncbi:hypothetical protein AVEN_218756-1 [Araneus ventricosus]|uniref:RNase H type-1 domain-containing protein n=1 Tax=Araneus ventricosus TaxID=182803 RepID=A0A4Y2B6H5_ARAVE|nr:hypothetical protein AVEN_218756-1 [Araneus ventricosus]